MDITACPSQGPLALWQHGGPPEARGFIAPTQFRPLAS